MYSRNLAILSKAAVMLGNISFMAMMRSDAVLGHSGPRENIILFPGLR